MQQVRNVTPNTAPLQAEQPGAPFFAHPSADVSPEARIGDGTKIWHQCQIRPGAKIGRNCILGKGVYVDSDVHIGNNVKIQNGVSVYHGVTIEDGAFCGPHCTFTNHRQPRAVTPDGRLRGADDWTVTRTLVRAGASIGANATIVCGVTLGRWAMVGAGAVVTRDVPDHGLVYGNPARLRGFVCACGEKLERVSAEGEGIRMSCPACRAEITLPVADWERLEAHK